MTATKPYEIVRIDINPDWLEEIYREQLAGKPPVKWTGILKRELEEALRTDMAEKNPDEPPELIRQCAAEVAEELAAKLVEELTAGTARGHLN